VEDVEATGAAEAEILAAMLSQFFLSISISARRPWFSLYRQKDVMSVTVICS